jgi:hypothetical protein
VDNCQEMIEFLRDNVHDRRFAYHFLDAYHPLYMRLQANSGDTRRRAPKHLLSRVVRTTAAEAACSIS